MRTSESGHQCGGSEVRIIAARDYVSGLLNKSHTSGVYLTFATIPTANWKSECQIQNSIRNRYLLVVLGFQHSQDCLLRRDANVGIGPLENNDLLVSFDSEVRKRSRRKMMRTRTQDTSALDRSLAVRLGRSYIG